MRVNRKKLINNTNLPVIKKFGTISELPNGSLLLDGCIVNNCDSYVDLFEVIAQRPQSTIDLMKQEPSSNTYLLSMQPTEFEK